MDRYTPIEDPALGLDRTLSSWSILFDNNPLRQDIFVEGTKIVLHDAYHVFQNLVSNYMGTHPVAGIGTSEEPVNLHLQSGHNIHTENTELEAPRNTLEHTLNNHNPSSTMEARDVESAGQPDSDRGNSSARTLLTPSRRMRMWVAILIVGVMSLIVVPGLVLGVVTKQLPWGIALCGLIATVISFFASFYYHLDK